MVIAATPPKLSTDYSAARRYMVDGQIRTNKVTDEHLLAALADLPREHFVAPTLQARAYLDDDLPLGNGRYMMQPMVLARLIQSLHVQPTDQILVVGATNGYSSALLARLGAHVTALEDNHDLVSLARTTLISENGNIQIVTGPLSEGHKQNSPYDAILIEGAVGEVPQSLSSQLKRQGKLVVVLRDNNVTNGRAVLMTKEDENSLSVRTLFDANTPLLPEFEHKPTFKF